MRQWLFADFLSDLIRNQYLATSVHRQSPGLQLNYGPRPKGRRRIDCSRARRHHRGDCSLVIENTTDINRVNVTVDLNHTGIAQQRTRGIQPFMPGRRVQIALPGDGVAAPGVSAVDEHVQTISARTYSSRSSSPRRRGFRR